MTTPIDDTRIEMARDAARDLRDHADAIRDEALAVGNTQAAEWALMMQRQGEAGVTAGRNLAASVDTTPPVDPPDPVEPGPDPEPGPEPEPTPPGKVRFGINMTCPHYWGSLTPWSDLMLSATWREQAGAFVAYAGAANPPDGDYRTSGCTVERGGSIEIKPHGSIADAEVLLPGTGDSFVHPRYREIVSDMGASVIRFMDAEQINNAPWDRPLRWSERMKPGDRRTDDKWGARVPLETIIRTCNDLMVNPWLCVPATADEEYTRNMAAMVREELHPDLTPTWEKSNEFWNTIFGQSNLVYVNGSWDFEAWAKMIRDMRGWLDAELSGRDYSVALGTKQTNTWMTKQLMDRLAGVVDAIAPAAYFGNGDVDWGAVFDDIRNKKREALIGQKEIADRYGLPLWTYEFGQHLSLKADIAMQRDGRMYDAYIEHFEMCQDAGVELMVGYKDVEPYTNESRYPMLEYMDQPLTEAPKMRAWVHYVEDQQP